MDFPLLQKKVKILTEKIRPRFKLYSQQEKEILFRTIKLNEEVGELCSEILTVLKLQRKSKVQKFSKKNFQHEFADVLILTMQLANATGIDLESAVQEKIAIIERRYKSHDL